MEEPVRKKNSKSARILWQIAVVGAMLALTTFLNLLLEGVIQPSSLVFLYLVSTIASAIYFGSWAAVLSSGGGLLIFDFLFVEPHYTLYISKPQDIYNVTVYFVVAVLITYLISIVRRQNSFLKDRLDRVSLVEEMSRDFMLLTPVERPSAGQALPESVRVRALSQLGQLVLRYAKFIVDAPAFVYFREKDGGLKVWAQSNLDLEITELDKSVAAWTLNNGEVSGSGTLTFPENPFFFIPMKSHDETVGGLGIRFNYRNLFPEQRRLLGTVSTLATIVEAGWTTVHSS